MTPDLSDHNPVEPVRAGDVRVRLDDRIRLMSAVLAATSYPQAERARSGHGIHAHARATRRHVAPLVDHPAVREVQSMLDQGFSLGTLFALALSGLQQSFEPSAVSFAEHLADFARSASLDEWWGKSPEWHKSLEDISAVLDGVQLRGFFEPFVGPVAASLTLMPNISYPTDRDIALQHAGELIVVVPPRLAWGESPPWPYADDPAHLYRAAIMGFGELLMRDYLAAHADALESVRDVPLPLNDRLRAFFPTWEDQFTGIFCAAAVAIYLEDALGRQEADSFTLMERKLRGMDILPAAISVLRRYRNDQAAGKYAELADLLPLFPKQLKVANRIKSL